MVSPAGWGPCATTETEQGRPAGEAPEAQLTPLGPVAAPESPGPRPACGHPGRPRPGGVGSLAQAMPSHASHSSDARLSGCFLGLSHGTCECRATFRAECTQDRHRGAAGRGAAPAGGAVTPRKGPGGRGAPSRWPTSAKGSAAVPSPPPLAAPALAGLRGRAGRLASPGGGGWEPLSWEHTAAARCRPPSVCVCVVSHILIIHEKASQASQA